jgi:hypothetical protein
MAKKKKIRSFAAKALTDPRFKPKIADTNKKKKDPKKSRRKWKNKGLSQ